ncbi:TPA: hypothetical protein ACNBA7_002936 [Legionella pneumophila]
MNYLLDIKQDLLVIPNGETIAQQSAISNQQSAIYGVSFLYIQDVASSLFSG